MKANFTRLYRVISCVSALNVHIFGAKRDRRSKAYVKIWPESPDDRSIA